MNIKQRFGKKLKRIRLEKGLSQEALALSADIDRTYVPSIEKGKRNISITILEKLAKALGVTISQLLEKI